MNQKIEKSSSLNIFDVIYGLITLAFVYIFGYAVKFFDLFGLGLNARWKPGEKLQILFLAYSGARNTGAEVRVGECIRQVNQVLGEENVSINMTTLDLKEAQEYFKNEKVGFLPMNAVFFWDVFKFVLRNHVVVLVEGSCWKENFAAALLFYFLYGAGLAAVLGKPCFSYAVDAGKMNGFNNWLSRALSKRMTRLIVRSADSKTVLETIGLPGAIIRVDTAWSQEAKPLKWGHHMLSQRGWDGKKPLIGLAMQNFFWWPVVPDFVRWIKGVKEYQYKLLYYYDYDENDKKQYAEWTKTLARFMDWAAGKYNAQLVVVAMEALDNQACRDLTSIMKEKAILVSCNEFVGTEIASILRNLNLLVTTRYHAMVLSMPGAVPFIGLSRDERIRGVMKETGLYPDYYVDYSLPDLLEQLQKRTGQIMENAPERQRIAGTINSHLPYYYVQMARLGLDIRQMIRESFLGIPIKAANESDPLELVPFVPPELLSAVKQQF
ncbi:MAG: polysaccharide pyruvyl transferase family protein [Elusimicrobia bacterium]|nr:polysaccharide pyruvyl transferase family protein [Elusimicrobiota bacterium]